MTIKIANFMPCAFYMRLMDKHLKKKGGNFINTLANQ